MLYRKTVTYDRKLNKIISSNLEPIDDPDGSQERDTIDKLTSWMAARITETAAKEASKA